MDHLVNEWFDRSTGVEELDRCSITLGHLYFGGMKKKDFLEILVEARKEGRDEDANTLLQVREQAGKALTQANIPQQAATQLLLNTLGKHVIKQAVANHMPFMHMSGS